VHLSSSKNSHGVLPKTCINKFRKHCLWSSYLNCKKPSKAAWPLVCLPKDCGGLGVLNLYTQNESLLLKHLHKFFNNLDVPWVQLIWSYHYQNGSLPLNSSRVSFWWNDVLKSLTSFKGMASAIIKDGSTCFFWTDVWNGRLLSSQYPELYSFAKDHKLSVQSFITLVHLTNLSDLFHLPLSSQAYSQFQQPETIIADTVLQEGNDTWSYLWGSSMFASSKTYS